MDLVSKTLGEGIAKPRRAGLCELAVLCATGTAANDLYMPSFPEKGADTGAAASLSKVAAAEVSTQEFSALAPRGSPGAVISDTRFDILGPGQDLEGTDVPH